MKRVFWLLITIAGMVFPAMAQDTLTFSRVEGFGADITEQVVKEAYHRLGILISAQPLPAERALSLAGSGDLDGEVSRVEGIEKNYPDLVMVPVPVTATEVVVFTKHVIFPVTGWESLKPYSIGILTGAKFAREGTQGMRAEPVTTDEQSFQKLDAGRIDVAVTTYINGLETIRKLNLKDIKALEPPVTTLKLYHYLHKKHMDLVPKITDVLKQMEKEGRMVDIRKKAIANHFK